MYEQTKKLKQEFRTENPRLASNISSVGHGVYDTWKSAESGIRSALNAPFKRYKEHKEKTKKTKSRGSTAHDGGGNDAFVLSNYQSSVAHSNMGSGMGGGYGGGDGGGGGGWADDGDATSGCASGLSDVLSGCLEVFGSCFT